MAGVLDNTPPGPTTVSALPLSSKPETSLDTRGFDDVLATRRLIYDRVRDEARKLPPLENKMHRLELLDVDYEDPDEVPLRKQKEAILTGQTLSRRLRGTWRLTDTNGHVLDERRLTLANVPHLTQRGTFVLGGTEYTLANQMRLRPGVFTRVKENGEVESHVNVLPGKGVSHRIFLDPETGVFRISVGQAKVPLLPVLKAMGLSDSTIREHWGNEIWKANASHDDPRAVDKMSQRLLRGQPDAPDGKTRDQRLAETLAKMELDPEVTQRTLGRAHTHLTPDAFFDITHRLVAVNRGEEDPDDRDHLAYQHLLGPEDLFAERMRAAQRVIRPLLWRATMKRNLAPFQPGFLTRHLQAAITGSGLGQALEEVNPSDIFNQLTRVSRLGEGGIPSIDSVPAEARNVQPSHFGYVDPLVTPESFRAGVDARLTSTVRKGVDGRIYTPFLNVRSGEVQHLSPQDVADKVIAFPGEMTKNKPMVDALVKGKLKYVPRSQVDIALPEMEHAFSPMANMIPLKSTIKGQRVMMGARMLTQALPPLKPEAPLVQTGMPGDPNRSYEEHYGRHMGAVTAAADGEVVAVSPDEIKVRGPAGVTTHELYNNFPYNRKTYSHNTPLVQVGQRVKAGDILARSNYTDDKGTTALGLNARVAYIPFRGSNFEDAIVISKSMAERLTSEHMYQHEAEWDEHVRRGKKAYVSVYPSTYDRKILETLDDDGVVKPGTVVEQGHPLVLMARERGRAHNQISRSKDTSFADQSLTWDHHAPGVVTDVAKTRKGALVTVKSVNEMQMADKLSGRFGDKGIVAEIVPDHEMPHDAAGRPFEVLLNPLGVITRCYDEETEFFTRSGWKKGINILPDERLLCYNPTEHCVQWHAQMNPMYMADHDGPMVRVLNDQVDLFVTLDHKLHACLIDADWNESTNYFDGLDWLVSTARAFLGKRILLPAPAALPRKRDDQAGVVDVVVEPEQWTLTRYKGLIFCPSVPTGFVVTRRNTKVICAGNTNPGQMVEAALGKIAAITGKPYKVQDFKDVGDMTEYALAELAKHGLSDTEDIIDPTTGGKIPGVFTGNRFFMKLHHTAEGKGQGRSTGGYTADEQPAKGGESGSKRVSLMDVNALLSHGATELQRDAGAIRGQKNQDYWAAFMAGQTPPQPRVPHVYRKFFDILRAGGINPTRDGPRIRIMALDNKAVQHLAGDRELANGETVDWKEGLKPVRGGLFDPTLTGGHGGNRWSAIRFHEPMPNPVMEEPIRRLLGLTEKRFEDILAGREELGGRRGPGALHAALARIDLDKAITEAQTQADAGRKTTRDIALKKLALLKRTRDLGLHPADWILDRAPVLPPMFRPVSIMAGTQRPMVADANLLYKDLLEANKNLAEMSRQVDDVGDERLAVYHAFKAVTGLGDPITPKNQERQVKGVLRYVFGSSPKFGAVQRHLLGSTVDLVGRAVIAPNPDLDMDQVGIPESKAWEIYRPFIIRRLARRGVPPLQAAELAKSQAPMARTALVEEMSHRPVIITRAPVLHRYGVMAFFPRLVKGEALQVPPLIVKGFAADFDGDAMNYHVPVSDEAVRDAVDKMLPSRNLFNVSNFQPHYLPANEYQGGLYTASAQTDAKRPERVFETTADALRAYRQRLIGADTRVVIVRP